MDHHDFLELLTFGDGVIDIGANEGHFSRQYADKVGRNGYVLAVEPGMEAAQRCRNDRPAQLHVLDAALSKEDGRRELFLDIDPKRNTLFSANLVQGSGSRSVRTTTLDMVAVEVPKLRAIKMDAQGSEVDILKGGTETLKKDIIWFVELWPNGLRHAGSSLGELLDIFQSAGYCLIGETWEFVREYEQRERSEHGSYDVGFMKVA